MIIFAKKIKVCQKKKKMKYRFDLLFSYWIFIWFIFYELRLIKQNPFFGLCVAMIVGTFDLYIIWERVDWIYFFVVYLIIKFIPFCVLIYTKRIKWDVGFTFALGFIYLVYLRLNNITNLDKLYYGKTKVAPFVAILKDIKS